MNFGYAYHLEEKSSIDLKPEDIADQYCWQMYEHLLRHHPPGPESHVLEVGSGRGGACFLISQYYQPKMVTGIDLSDHAIDFCRNTYQGNNLNYVVAPANKLPVSDETIDLVINAESSHAYPDFNQFVSEVYRVLKPGGYLMTADIRKVEFVDEWKLAMLDAGLVLKHEKDITDHVIVSLNQQESVKENLILSNVPAYFRPHFRQFAGMQGSHIYNDFSTRKTVYKSFILQKPS